jgi:putative Ca2+/H+ antiporter (TMEM165/GDT1 family)
VDVQSPVLRLRSEQSGVRTLKDIFPSSTVINAVVVAHAITTGSAYKYSHSSMTLVDAAIHIGIGAIAFVAVCASFFMDMNSEEKKNLIGLLRGRTR